MPPPGRSNRATTLLWSDRLAIFGDPRFWRTGSAPRRRRTIVSGNVIGKTAPLLLFNVKSSMRGFGNRGAAGSYLKQNYEMLAERARGLLSGEVSRPDEHETRRQQSNGYSKVIAIILTDNFEFVNYCRSLVFLST
jgi:hypothetical protein